MACDCPAGRLGLSVCYDLRFPEVYQRLAHELGAQILLVPSAFTVATGGWRTGERARGLGAGSHGRGLGAGWLA